MTDYRTGMLGPATHGFVITPHDTNPLAVVPRAIRADAAGEVTLRLVDSAADITINMVAGEVFFGLVTHVRDTGTDAIVLHGLA